ncbi:MAG: DUF2779 domain-containing protein [Thermoplasmata archaeon]
MKATLSKSRYMDFLQCPKLFYYSVNLRDRMPPFDAATQFRLDQGGLVGAEATKMFPGGERVEPFPLDAAVKRTKEAIKEGVKYIYEASFEHNGVHCKVDILHNPGNGILNIYEVKSTKSRKPEHIPDIAIQRWIVEGAGYRIGRTCLVTLNADYVHPKGDLFVTDDCTEEAEALLPGIPAQVEEMKRVAEAGNLPETDIGPHCAKPHECPLESVCWANIPELSIFNIPGYRKRWPLYQQGIVELKDLPDLALNANQKAFVQAWRTGKPVIDRQAVRAELARLEEPIYFLDFETINWAMPRHEGMSPYDVVTFQYSLHILDNGKLTHKEFLWDNAGDPRLPLLETLLGDLGEKGPIAVYTGFEEARFKELANAFPQHRNRVDRAIARLWDMAKIFKDYYADARFLGKYSIKNVLPVMVPELSYKDLDIQDGGLAMVQFARMIEAQEEEKEKIRAALLKYCERDTEAMVRILERLREV